METGSPGEMDDRKVGVVANFVISALGPAFAVVATNPFDVVKCRLQMQNELRRGKGPYRGPIDCFRKTLSNEGIRGIQRGLPVCILRDFTKGFWRIGLYQPLIYFVHGDETIKGRPGLSTRIVVGAICGFVSSAVRVYQSQLLCTEIINIISHIRCQTRWTC